MKHKGYTVSFLFGRSVVFDDHDIAVHISTSREAAIKWIDWKVAEDGR